MLVWLLCIWLLSSSVMGRKCLVFIIYCSCGGVVSVLVRVRVCVWVGVCWFSSVCFLCICCSC